MCKTYRLGLIAIIGLLFSCSVWAERAPEYHSELARIEHYLNSLTTIVADFTQVAPDGSLTGGKFYLKRPGRMRWQYDPPTPLLMVADGTAIVFYDYELQQVTNIPLDSTLASFLAQAKVDLHDPALVIQGLTSEAGTLRLTLARKGRETEGSLMLEFSDHPLTVRNMVVRDAQGQVTTLSLNNAKFGETLDNTLFQFHDPRGPRKRL